MIVVATYMRVSTLEQAKTGYGLQAQRHALDALVSQHPDWINPPHLQFVDGEDESASGYRSDLPEVTAMFAAAERGEFQILALPKLDRLSRRGSNGWAYLDRLRELEIQLVDPYTPIGSGPFFRSFMRQQMDRAKLDRDIIAENTSMGRRAKAQSNKVTGQGFAPFGYTFSFETFPNGRSRVNGLAIDPIAEPIVREILARIAHEPAGAVAKHLNAHGYPTPSAHRLGDGGAKAWTGSLVINIARSTTYAGAWVYGKEGGRKSRKHEAPVNVDVPAYISMAQYEENRAALLERKAGGTARTQPGLTDRFTLRRMLHCGHCGGRLITMNLKRGKHRYYTCRQHWVGDCPMKMVPAEAIEREAKTILSATLLNPVAIDRAVKNQKTAGVNRPARRWCRAGRVGGLLPRVDGTSQSR